MNTSPRGLSVPIIAAATTNSITARKSRSAAVMSAAVFATRAVCCAAIGRHRRPDQGNGRAWRALGASQLVPLFPLPLCYDALFSGRRRCRARGCSSMVEQKPSKLMTRVRFPSPAPFFSNTCGIVIPCTRAIFDDHWLPKCSVQMFGHDAGQNVSRAAGSKWHHEYNRSIGVRRSVCIAQRRGCRKTSCGREDGAPARRRHWLSPQQVK